MWILEKARERKTKQLVESIKTKGLTYLSERKISSLVSECRSAAKRMEGGKFVEAGCALGGSTVIIASLLSKRKVMHVYDTFEGMPPPTAHDTPDVHERYQVISTGKSVGIDGAVYYGYRENLLHSVRATLDEYLPTSIAGRVHLIKGFVQDTMNDQDRVAFAHVDVDWYDPVLHCAGSIFPRLEVGGSIIFDDYLDYGSCKNAVDDYFEPHKSIISMDTSAGSCCVRKLWEV